MGLISRENALSNSLQLQLPTELVVVLLWQLQSKLRLNARLIHLMQKTNRGLAMHSKTNNLHVCWWWNKFRHNAQQKPRASYRAGNILLAIPDTRQSSLITDSIMSTNLLLLNIQNFCTRFSFNSWQRHAFGHNRNVRCCSDWLLTIIFAPVGERTPQFECPPRWSQAKVYSHRVMMTGVEIIHVDDTVQCQVDTSSSYSCESTAPTFSSKVL